MAAYNAAKTLEKTVRDIPSGCADEIVVVDDASTDDTVKVAKRLGLRVIVHPDNRGYGANQKTCYDEALRRGPDIIVMIYGDYQYDSRLTPYIVGIIRDGIRDVVLGSRIRTRWEALDSGMPLYKYLSNRFLTLTENVSLAKTFPTFTPASEPTRDRSSRRSRTVSTPTVLSSTPNSLFKPPISASRSVTSLSQRGIFPRCQAWTLRTA